MAVLDEHTVHGHRHPVVWVHRRAGRKTMTMTRQPEIMPSSGRSASAAANAIRCTGLRWALQIVRNLAGGGRRRVLLVLVLGRTLERRHAGLRPDRRQVFQVAIVGKQPIFTPQLTQKRVGVGKTGLTYRGLADMRDDVGGANGVLAHQLGDG